MSSRVSKQTKTQARNASPEEETPEVPLSSVEAQKPFSPTIITNFLNNHYKNEGGEQHLTFKNYPSDKSKMTKTDNTKPVINLNDYFGLQVFIDQFKEMKDSNYTELIDQFAADLKLRACLDIANKYTLNNRDKMNVFEEYVIPQLGFGKTRDISIVDYINAIQSIFDDDTKIKTKLYNSIFPHADHDLKKYPRGVNLIYLQHISKFHDEILDMLITQKMDDQAILSSVQERFTKQCLGSSKLTMEEKKRATLQMLNPLIVERVMKPPMIEVNHKQVVDQKWIDTLTVYENKKGDYTVTEAVLTKLEKTKIKELVRELSIAKSFIKIIRGAEQARKIIGLEGEVEPSETGTVIEERDRKGKSKGRYVVENQNVDLKFCLDEYKNRYAQIQEFRKKWQAKIAAELEKINLESQKERSRYQSRSTGTETEENEESTLKSIGETIKDTASKLLYNLFLKFFVKVARFLRDKLGIDNPVKAITSELKRGVSFKFNKKLREGLNKLIDAEQKPRDMKDTLMQLAEEHYADWKTLNCPKTYDVNELSVYSKIGKFCGLNLKKDYRIAVGVAIVAYIQEQIALIKAKYARRKEVQVFIKV